MTQAAERGAAQQPRLSFERLEPRAMLSVADLSGFQGVGNTSAPNDYTGGAVAAGGTFDSRRQGAGEAAAYLADTMLNVSGGVLTRATSGGFGATGILTFDASPTTTLADPVFYFGFFDNDDLTSGAFGFSLAHQAATSFRFRASAGTTQTSGSGIVVAEGSYAFDLDVNNAQSGANKIRFRMVDEASTTVLDVSVNIPVTLALQADSFGFLQPLAGSPSDNTFSLSIRDVTYTGATLASGTPTAPAAPSDLTAAPVANRVNLIWQDNSNNEHGFTIERCTGNGAFAPLANVTAGVAAYLDDSVTAETSYVYRVRAYNDAGTSPWSPEAAITTPEASSDITITATDYSRTQIYHGSQAEGFESGDPSWTSWVGTWLMPNGDLMVSVTQATGPEQPIHDRPSPYTYRDLDINVVYLRSSNGGASWTKVAESDVSFTTPESSGQGTHANNGPTTIALEDGSLIRRVYGWDYQDYPDMPGTTFMQRSTDGGVTWSAAPVSTDGGQTWSDPSPIQEFLLDPASTTVQMTRTRRLSDGRLLIGGSVWNGRNTQSAPNEPLLMVSADDGASWQRVEIDGPAYVPDTFNEWDFAELDNGDLFLVSRPKGNDSRWQGVMTKVGDTWQLQTWGLSVLPHSGHPELLKTKEGPVLHIATTGTHWTVDAGQTWHVLDVDSLADRETGDYRSMYYPHSVQTPDGWIYVFAHRSSPGGDDNYGNANQAVFMDKFRLVAEGGPERVDGDYNGDARVDGADLSEWAESFGRTLGALKADGDADGDVDGKDLLVWQRNLRPTAGAATLQSQHAVDTVSDQESIASEAAFAELAGEGLPKRTVDPSATAFQGSSDALRKNIGPATTGHLTDGRLRRLDSQRLAFHAENMTVPTAALKEARDAALEFTEGRLERWASALATAIQDPF